MKILFFRGNFSCDGTTIHNGLVCWCHFSPEDTNDLVPGIVERIYDQSIMGEDIILVPFCFDVPKRTMHFDEAKQLFQSVGRKIKNAVIVPFKEENSLLLKLGKNQAYVECAEVISA